MYEYSSTHQLSFKLLLIYILNNRSIFWSEIKHKQNDGNDPNKYHPISLVNCRVKIFNKVLPNRLVKCMVESTLAYLKKKKKNLNI